MIVFFAITHSAFVQFLTGSWLAYVYFSRRESFVLSKRASIALIAIGLMVFAGTARWLPATIGSLLIIAALVESAYFTKLMSGRIGVMLGTASFPLYLVHTLVILSLTSFVYVKLADAGLSTVPLNVVAITVTLVGSFVGALPFIRLETWWVSSLNRAVSQIVARLSSARAPVIYATSDAQAAGSAGSAKE